VTNTDREAGAILLRQLRKVRGWSWSELARALRETACRLGIDSLIEPALAGYPHSESAKYGKLFDHGGLKVSSPNSTITSTTH
jgi:hypothetical protein